MELKSQNVIDRVAYNRVVNNRVEPQDRSIVTAVRRLRLFRSVSVGNQQSDQRKVKRNGQVPADPARDSMGAHEHHQAELPNTPQGYASVDVSPVLQYFALRPDGWLRTIPDGEQKVVYLKWKFTRGRWSGFYGFVSGSPYQINFLLVSLMHQLEAIDEGNVKPTRDRWFEN